MAEFVMDLWAVLRELKKFCLLSIIIIFALF
jgi:hypothetical protein